MGEWWKTGMPPKSSESLDNQLRKLGNRVYMFNLEMIRAV
jgi:hypothetical protein